MVTTFPPLSTILATIAQVKEKIGLFPNTALVINLFSKVTQIKDFIHK